MVKKKKESFYESASNLLTSIGEVKKELRKLKNEEIRRLNLREREEIKLVKERTKKQRELVLKRYEKKKQEIGKALLRRKSQELSRHLSSERRSLSKTNKEINRITRNRKKLKKK